MNETRAYDNICAVCFSDNTKHCFDYSDYRISRCAKCTHVFVASQISDDALTSAYGQSYYVAEDASGPPLSYSNYLATVDRRLAGFKQWYEDAASITGRRGRSLDYGCAIGVAVKAAEAAGWLATGYERSHWAVEFGRSHFGVNIVQGDGSSSIFDTGSFDLVTMFDVVEHLQRPSQIMGRVRDWISIGGHVAITTVNSASLGARLAAKSWRHLAPPFHLQYFTHKSLETLLVNNGFEICRTRFNGPVLGARRDWHPSVLTDRVEAVVSSWRAQRILSRVPLGDEIDVVARRVN